MKTRSAPPYLLAPENSVIAEEWHGKDGSELSERLEHWDPFTDIDLERVVNIDADAIRESCQLGVDSALAVTASWTSTRTRLGGDASTVELGTLDGRLRAPLTMSVPGPVAGGRLDLRTRLILRRCGTTPSAISPRRPGAILWSEHESLDLEGSAARFPITPADFTAIARLPDHGSWALEWDSEAFEAPLLGAVRLLVNTEQATFIDALRSGGSSAHAALTRSFVTYDVARSLVEGALRSKRFVDDAETFDEGSVGRMLFQLLASCWPGIPVATLARRRIDDPARIDAELQQYLGVGL
jgi:hypothetical protein